MRKNTIPKLAIDHAEETTRKLFHDFQLDDPIFNNRNIEFLNSLITEGKSAYYEDGFLQPEDKLYYKIEGNWETYSVSMKDLIVYAIEDFNSYKSCCRCVIFRCVHTGTFFELTGYESDRLPLEEEDEKYAYEISMTDDKLRGFKYVTLYNQRYYKLHNFLNN